MKEYISVKPIKHGCTRYTLTVYYGGFRAPAKSRLYFDFDDTWSLFYMLKQLIDNDLACTVSLDHSTRIKY